MSQEVNLPARLNSLAETESEPEAKQGFMGRKIFVEQCTIESGTRGLVTKVELIAFGEDAVWLYNAVEDAMRRR
jgi:hypothetical protein